MFDDEEGEDMVGFDINSDDARGRREQLASRADHDIPGEREERRLSRELEEGFRDDSSDDESDRGPESRR